MSENRKFPPGIGWVPLAIAIGVATIVSIAAIVPQFETKTIGTAAAPGQQVVGGGPAQSLAPGQTPGPTGQYVGSNGRPGSTAGPGGGALLTGGKCGPGHNGGNTAPGVTDTEIRITTTQVTTGVGAGFLGEAVQGMKAALQEFNVETNGAGICGRRIVLNPEPVNDGWDRTTGQRYIESYISSGNVFALVGEPDSEGLSGAIDSQDIDRAGIPVVGTDGMLKDQYHSPWVYPVAASTVTNMHIIVQYAIKSLKAKSFGIVFDQHYKFGQEGAQAFANEIKRLGGPDITQGGSGNCSTGYCPIQSSDENGGGGGYDSQIQAFNQACKPCDVVVMLLEPKPMEDWMTGEGDFKGWYTHLMGGEPLFDYKFGTSCGDACKDMTVWTGYKPNIAPFDGEPAVYKYAHALQSQCNSCDSHNEFTEGAYLGTRLFIAAVQKVADEGELLTRDNLKRALDTMSFDSGLTAQPIRFGGLPHLANGSMAAYTDNSSGTFNGFTYRSDIGFLQDPAPGSDQ